MVGAGTSCKYLFDLRPGDVYWCTADCGWITGHTYLTYGPLLNGATQVGDWLKCVWDLIVLAGLVHEPLATLLLCHR